MNNGIDIVFAYNVMFERMSGMGDKELADHLTNCAAKYGLAFINMLSEVAESETCECSERVRKVLLDGAYAAEQMTLQNYFKDNNIEATTIGIAGKIIDAADLFGKH